MRMPLFLAHVSLSDLETKTRGAARLHFLGRSSEPRGSFCPHGHDPGMMQIFVVASKFAVAWYRMAEVCCIDQRWR